MSAVMTSETSGAKALHRLFRFSVVSKAVGSFLVIAAAFKVHGLALDTVSRIGTFSAPEFQVFVAECEVFLGLWLLSGKRPIGSWLGALVAFSCFAGASAYQGWLGRASCGCFGALVVVNPWFVFGIDVVILAILLAARPDLGPFRDDPRAALWRAITPLAVGCFGVAAILGLFVGVAHLAFVSSQAALAYLRGEHISAYPRVVDMGDGVPGEIREATVELGNWTDRPVRLIGGTSDCSCVVTEDLPVTIPPGEARPITVKMRLPTASGIFNRKAILLTDDDRSPRLLLRLTGTISKPREETQTAGTEKGS